MNESICFMTKIFAKKNNCLQLYKYFIVLYSIIHHQASSKESISLNYQIITFYNVHRKVILIFHASEIKKHQPLAILSRFNSN